MQNRVDQTPHLETALTGPLQLLESKILNRQSDIESWFKQQWHKTPALVYGSVDLRNAGFKLAPVDMNLFPGGFNNLNPEFISLSVDAARSVITGIDPSASKILLIPESHTRNLFYWDNIAVLISILNQAGFDVRVGSLIPNLNPTQFKSQRGHIIEVHPIHREGDRLQLDSFQPDLVLLNNDLSEGIPSLLQNLSQIIVPPSELGWSQRLKSEHFQRYAEVSEEFAGLLGIDPWFISPYFRHCGEIDFMNREGEDCLSRYVSELLEQIKQKYLEYNITCNPFLIVKADAGTYGMAVMTVRSADEVRSLNRKQRTRMSQSKGGKPVHKVIIQEGVYTFETWGPNNAVAEPVVYLWGQHVVGGFYRVHQDRNVDENLNSPGMQFEPLAFVKSCNNPDKEMGPDECQNRFYAYGVIARLSMLAAARE